MSDYTKTHGLSDERVNQLEARAKEVAHQPPPDPKDVKEALKTLRESKPRGGEPTSWEDAFDNAIATLEAMRDAQRAKRAELGLVEETPEDTEIWPDFPQEAHFELYADTIHTPWMKDAESITAARLALPCARCDADGFSYDVAENGYDRRVRRCRCYGWKKNAKFLSESRLPARAAAHGLDRINWRLVSASRLVPSAFGDARFEPVSIESEARRILRRTSHEGSGRLGLLLYGDTGTAKSHIIQGLGRRAALVYGAKVRWVNWPSLLERLKSSFNGSGETVSSIIGWLTSCDMLILDEIGGENVSGWAQTRMEEVLTICENRGITLLASTNYGKDRLKREIGEPSVSRLLGLCELVVMQGRDYRSMSVKEREAR